MVCAVSWILLPSLVMFSQEISLCMKIICQLSHQSHSCGLITALHSPPHFEEPILLPVSMEASMSSLRFLVLCLLQRHWACLLSSLFSWCLKGSAETLKSMHLLRVNNEVTNFCLRIKHGRPRGWSRDSQPVGWDPVEQILGVTTQHISLRDHCNNDPMIRLLLHMELGSL